MTRKMSLRAKLLSIGIVLSLLPVLIVGGIVYRQNRTMSDFAGQETIRLAYEDLDHIAEGVNAMCAAQEEVLQQMVNSNLRVAAQLLETSGGVALNPDETVDWQAINQVTSASSPVRLPKMHVGDVWLGQNRDMNTPSPLVDEVTRLVGGTCTIFQRMNETGDMLRVATNVQTAEGNRAIGTYIPRSQADGAPNPVLAAVLGGKTFQGRARVVGNWYITAYEPIRDAQGHVVGMLYVGIPQESATGLRQAIMNTKVGKTGYVFVLNAKGDTRGHYVVSQNGARDGDNILETRDPNGTFIIKEMCDLALTLKPGEIGEYQYPWKNPDDPAPRMKVVRLMYFEPWDWVIGPGSYIDEFTYAQQEINRVARTGNMMQLGVGAISLIAAALIWFVVARGLGNRIGGIVNQLTSASDQTTSASAQVAQSSQSMAEGASEQASSLEETSASLEEMTSMTKQNAENANQASQLMEKAKETVGDMARATEEMSKAIAEIKASSDQTAKIIKTIDEIAFQTNLLALNAAVEAARAGDAGKGFAVVAEEVRNLAQRSAEAAKNTAEMIAGSVKNADNGVKVTERVADALKQTVSNAEKVAQLVAEIAAASNEQAQGIEQINTAVAQMDQVTQSNAASSEESASAAEELSAQAEEMRRMVQDLVAVVEGEGNAAAPTRSAASKAPARRAPAARALTAPRKVATQPPAKAAPGRALLKPEQIIPLNDDDLEEF